MEEFLGSYGLWLLLAAVFVGMHWFGRGCGGASHRPRGDTTDRKGANETPAGTDRQGG